MMAGFIGVSSYVGQPIACFPPAEFTIQWRKYVDNMCWVGWLLNNRRVQFVPFAVHVQFVTCMKTLIHGV